MGTAAGGIVFGLFGVLSVAVASGLHLEGGTPIRVTLVLIVPALLLGLGAAAGLAAALGVTMVETVLGLTALFLLVRIAHYSHSTR